MSDEEPYWATVALRDGVLVYTDLFSDEGNMHERAEAFESLLARSDTLTFWGYVCHQSEKALPPPKEPEGHAFWEARARLVTITPDRINYITI